MDLLARLHSGELSLEEARNIFNEQIAKFHRGESTLDWREAFELSNYEATAYAHGATFSDLVKLRYEGWPTTCSRCGRPIDYKQYGWLFVHSEDGIPRLRHVVCPTRSDPRQRKRTISKKSKRATSKERTKRH